MNEKKELSELKGKKRKRKSMIKEKKIEPTEKDEDKNSNTKQDGINTKTE